MKKKNKNKSLASKIDKEMTMGEYYELFIKPALQLYADDKEQRLGVAFIRYIVNGERPKLKSDVDKLLWNCLMIACNVGFNSDFENTPAYKVQEAMAEAETK